MCVCLCVCERERDEILFGKEIIQKKHTNNNKIGVIKEEIKYFYLSYKKAMNLLLALPIVPNALYTANILMCCEWTDTLKGLEVMICCFPSLKATANLDTFKVAPYITKLPFKGRGRIFILPLQESMLCSDMGHTIFLKPQL